MKTINNIRASLFTILLSCVAVAFVLTGCDKKFEMDLPLAVNSRAVSLSSSAGSTHMMVYSDGAWTARFTRNVTWASLNKQGGYGNNEIIFTYSANYGVTREVGVILEKGELADTVIFTQAGAVSDASIMFPASALNLVKAAATVTVPMTTNIRYSISDMEASITYYDENGLACDPVPVITKAEGDETSGEGGEGEGETDEPKANPVTPWISNVSIAVGKVSFDVTANEGTMPRLATLEVFIKYGENDEERARLSLTQGISDPAFSLESKGNAYDGIAADCVIPATANNIVAYADQVNWTITYTPEVAEGEGWVTGAAITSQGLEFSLKANEGTESRTAVIAMEFTDSAGNKVSDSYTVTQVPYPAMLTFQDVRAMTPGEITASGYIDAYVVSDRASKNIISSPQTAQFKYDRSVNDRTVYIESTDGAYGFCIQFADAAENTLERYSKVRLSLAGATLEKHADPEYYTITGLTAANILETAVPDLFKIPVKNKKITELTDNDIFTLVNISDMEIMCKDGAYTNCTDGYSTKDDVNPIGTSSPRWDVAPLLCYDNQGNSIYMLTNAAVPWRRFSSGRDLDFHSVVPQGSGTFKGIVVADEVAPVRFGDLGRYQLRAMVEEDIDLNDTPFSNTIVEWNWNDRANDLTPEIGSGAIDVYGATGAASADFNNVVCSGNSGGSSEQKGLVTSGAIKLTQQWWDFENNVGKYIDISFSTQGLSGSNMIFGIVWGHGDMNNTTLSGPSHWNLLYSVDGGETFNPVPDCPMLKKRSVTWWSDTSQDATPGFTEHLRKLPSDCFGKSKVVLRLQVADTVTDIAPKTSASTYLNALGIEKGQITASTTAASSAARIGTVTVRYN